MKTAWTAAELAFYVMTNEKVIICRIKKREECSVFGSTKLNLIKGIVISLIWVV